MPTKETSSNSEVKPQSYAEQRERLNKSVDDMMVTLKAAGFNGNTTVNGAPAISAQLDALSTSTTLTAPSVTPTMEEPNGASIDDPHGTMQLINWIQMLTAIPILFGIFKTGKVRQIKVVLPIAMVAIM